MAAWAVFLASVQELHVKCLVTRKYRCLLLRRIPTGRFSEDFYFYFYFILFLSVVELADSTAELADSSTDSVIVGRLSLSNMFNILRPLELADGPMVNLSSGYGPLIVRNPDVACHCNLYLPAMS